MGLGRLAIQCGVGLEGADGELMSSLTCCPWLVCVDLRSRSPALVTRPGWSVWRSS